MPDATNQLDHQHHEAISRIAENAENREEVALWLDDLAAEIRDEDPPDVIDRTTALSRRFQSGDGSLGVGALQFYGTCGFHTYFDHSDGLDYALETAQHAAFHEATLETTLDPKLIRDTHGELTPETATAELTSQLRDFYGIHVGEHGFWATYTDELQTILREWEPQLEGARA